MNTQARRHRALINIAHGVTHYSHLILPTAVLAMLAPGGAFGSDYGHVLELSTFMFILYGLLSLPQGWLAERLGRKTMMSLFFLGTGASLITTGFVDSSLWLAVTLTGVGVFTAIYHPIGTAILVDAAGDEPGRALGFNGMIGISGVALAPMLTAFFAQYLGWRAAFMLPGLACIVIGVMWLRTPAIEGHYSVTSRPFPDIPPAVVRRAVGVLLLLALLSGLVFNAYTLLIPKLMAERLAQGRSDMLPWVGMAAFFVMLCGAATQFAIGRLIDRMTLKRILLPLSVMLVGGLLVVSVAQDWAVIPASGIVAAVLFGQVTVNETMTARYISPPLRARLYSIRFFVGFLGSAAAPFIIAILLGHFGDLAAVILALAGCSILSLAAALAFPDRKEELAPELWALARTAPE